MSDASAVAPELIVQLFIAGDSKIPGQSADACPISPGRR
jgi:hypothetical protein